MSKSEILAALAFLRPEERREVRAKLDQLDGFAPDDWLDDGELSVAEKHLIEERMPTARSTLRLQFRGRWPRKN